MKAKIIISLLASMVLFASAFVVQAATPPTTAQQGGTGWSGIFQSGILYGQGASNLRLATTSAGTAGFVLSYQNGIPKWVATTTFSSGLSYSGGNVTNTGVTAIAGANGITLTGSTGSVTVGNQNQISTSSISTSGIAWFTGTSPTVLSSRATTTASCSGSVSCTGFDIFGSSPVTITSSALTSAVTSLKQTFGSALTGALTMATSTLVLNGQTHGLQITDNGSNTFTFTPTLSGTLSEAGGGTNQSTYTKGDVLYASAANTLTKLGIGTGGQVLASVAGIPGWVATTTYSTGLTYTSGTNAVTVNTSQNITTLSNLTSNGIVYTSGAAGTLNVAAFSANTIPYVNGAGTALIYTATSSLNLGVTGGGTGLTAAATGDLLYGSNTNVLSRLAAGTGGFVLSMAGGLPSWVATTTFSSGLTYAAGNVTNTGVTSIVSGTGVTISGGTGAVTINSLSSSKWATSTDLFAIYPNGLTNPIVGIGTTTPKFTLTVSSSTRSQLALTDGSLTSNPWNFRSVNGNLYIASSSPSTFATSTLSALSIINSGQSGVIGIGTDNPAGVNANARLTVAGNGSQDIIASTTDNTTISDAILEAYAPGSRVFLGAHGTNQVSTRYGITLGGWGEIGAFNSTFNTTNGLIIGTLPAVPIVFGTNNAERVRIDSSGNVGIGTTTGTKLLTVYGTQSGGIVQFIRNVNGVAANLLGTFDVALKSVSSDVNDTGPAQTFSYLGLNGTLNTLASIGAYREGANNTGELAFTAYNAGSAGEILRIRNNNNGAVGVGTTTPVGIFNISNPSNGTSRFPQLVISDIGAAADSKHWFASTTASVGNLAWGTINDAMSTLTTYFTMTRSGALGFASTTPSFSNKIVLGTPGSTAPGSIVGSEYDPATSTSMTLDWSLANQYRLKMGTSAFTIAFSNATPGQTLRVVLCNPDSGTGGAVTWTGPIHWSAGTKPTQTTTALQCDIWSFINTAATSTTNGTTSYFGNASTGFQ